MAIERKIFKKAGLIMGIMWLLSNPSQALEQSSEITTLSDYEMDQLGTVLRDIPCIFKVLERQAATHPWSFKIKEDPQVSYVSLPEPYYGIYEALRKKKDPALKRNETLDWIDYGWYQNSLRGCCVLKEYIETLMVEYSPISIEYPLQWGEIVDDCPPLKNRSIFGFSVAIPDTSPVITQHNIEEGTEFIHDKVNNLYHIKTEKKFKDYIFLFNDIINRVFNIKCGMSEEGFAYRVLPPAEKSFEETNKMLIFQTQILCGSTWKEYYAFILYCNLSKEVAGPLYSIPHGNRSLKLGKMYF